jgi:hypothetical protein
VPRSREARRLAAAGGEKARGEARALTAAGEHRLTGGAPPVYVVLPFRGEHIDLLPSVLKHLALAGRRIIVPFHVVIAPVSWDHQFVEDVKARMSTMLALAASELGFNITLAASGVDGAIKRDVVRALLGCPGWGFVLELLFTCALRLGGGAPVHADQLHSYVRTAFPGPPLRCTRICSACWESASAGGRAVRRRGVRRGRRTDRPQLLRNRAAERPLPCP